MQLTIVKCVSRWQKDDGNKACWYQRWRHAVIRQRPSHA